MTQLYHYVNLFLVKSRDISRIVLYKGVWRLASTKSQKLIDELNKLQVASHDIQASAIVSTDGLIIASALPRNVEEDRVSAMSAAMLSLGERISLELRRGDLDQVYIRGDNGYVMLMAVGADAVLTILAGVNAKLGLIFFEIRRAAQALEELI